MDNLHYLPQTSRVAPFPHQVRDRWQYLRSATPNLRRHFLSGSPLIDFYRDDPAAAAFDRLRTDLSHRLRRNGWRRIAVAAPTAGCGSTFATSNLGQSFAGIRGSRTLLVDLNLRNPGLVDALDVSAEGDMAGYLTGRIALEQHVVRINDSLALAPSCRAEPDAAGVFLGSGFATALDRMTGSLVPDVAFFDVAPMLEFEDLGAVLPNMDAVLLIAGGGRTRAAQITACRQMLKGKAPLLGVVLNDLPDSPITDT